MTLGCTNVPQFKNNLLTRMKSYILTFREIYKSNLPSVGGKGSNLSELSRIQSLSVPEGFCITTSAYADVIFPNVDFSGLLTDLSRLKIDDRAAIKEVTTKIRQTIENIPVPKVLQDAIINHIKKLGDKNAYAVRSSATAEDLPGASFAGQQDTYLNIIGADAIVRHVRKCWASLFTERAVIYRLQNGFDHRKVSISVIVQKMVHPDVSGIMFTADPVSGNRKIISIDASFGLGEALVSGLVNADLYKVKDDFVFEKKVGSKKMMVAALAEGGTEPEEIAEDIRNSQALNDDQILHLSKLGRIIEKHFGVPQDIEWCLVEDAFHILQSRPITNLFPIPETSDTKNRVYISVGHQQMMTDAIKPLGLSLWQLTSFAPMYKAGGRLFVDITDRLSSVQSRAALLEAMLQHDPLIRSAIDSLIERGDFIPSPVDEGQQAPGLSNNLQSAETSIENDPSIVVDLMRASEESLQALKKTIQKKSGTELLDFIREDVQLHFRKSLFDPRSIAAIMAGINASIWINEKINEWLGEKNVADLLARSAPGNITSEMGLQLLDVADKIRPYPEIISFLENTKSENFLNDLPHLNGGREAQVAIRKYLDKYGMRCAGEIDITRTRWSENPTILIPVILSHIRTFEPGESIRKYQKGRQEALQKEEQILTKLQHLPDGDQKAYEAKKRIALIRNFSGYREYPKYSIVNRYFVYKQALLEEADRSLSTLGLQDKHDIYYLSLQEIQETIQNGALDQRLIDRRKDEYKRYVKMTPPRVITSDGEVINGKYNRDKLSANTILGLAVSSGVVEGRARVLMSMDNADIADGDILVTKFTDPSWTPLFVTIKGLVTEVGGLMTHGAVIAREYGLPAVVGVENATKIIRDGQRIRVDGTNGFVQVC